MDNKPQIRGGKLIVPNNPPADKVWVQAIVMDEKRWIELTKVGDNWEVDWPGWRIARVERFTVTG